MEPCESGTRHSGRNAARHVSAYRDAFTDHNLGHEREHGRVRSSPGISILSKKSTTSSRNSSDKSGGTHDSCAGMNLLCRSLELHTLWWRRIVCSSTKQNDLPTTCDFVALLFRRPCVSSSLRASFLSLQIPEVRLLVVLHNLQASSPWRRLGAVMRHFSYFHGHFPLTF